jgi:DeoR/GlpR family transcriptional regulator of sugar metabolism
MLASDRRARILQWIVRDGTVETVKVAHVLNVTDMTVRRDLAILERRGLVERVYGGAILATEGAPELRLFRGLLDRYTDDELDRVREFLLATCGLLEAARTSHRPDHNVM